MTLAISLPRQTIIVVTLALMSLVVFTPLVDAEPFTTVGHLTSKTPYQPQQAFTSLSALPAGYAIAMVQHVARHGSRGLSSADDDDLMLQLWQQALTEGALTPLGEELGPVLRDIMAIHAGIGYGSITSLGESELEQMAQRLTQRQPALFNAAISNNMYFEVHHSGRTRALQSAEAFTRGLIAASADLAALISTPAATPDTVYFNDAEGSEDFQRFRDADPRLLTTLDLLRDPADAEAMARRLLSPLFTADFVQRLADGHYQFQATADPDDRLENLLDAAEALYGLYSISPALSDQLGRDLGHFMEPVATAWFAELDDAESFYDRGPSFADDDITWRGARALFDDMMQKAASATLADNNLAATLRFSHSQALVPLVVLLGIEGSSEGLPPETLYSYATSPWRSATAAPMAANIQWDIYRNDAGNLLVRMLHNEAEVHFMAGCQSYAEGFDYFYALEELQRCYAHRGVVTP